MLICECCGKKAATFHVTEIIGNEKKEVHLCEDCAREKNVALPTGLNDFLTSLLEQAEKEVPELNGVTCPLCGITYAEFRSGGGLGCSRDYAIFKKGLLPFLERIHGSTRHKGKIPVNAGKGMNNARKLIQLRRELNKAIDAEKYEEAAQIRDRIYELKKGENADGD